MIIFQLLVYGCVWSHGLGGDTLSCRWDERGFYREQSACEDAGAAELGKPIHEFSMLRAGPRKVERSKCTSITVN